MDTFPYKCLFCDALYAVRTGESIRCPECGSKDREYLLETHVVCRNCQNSGVGWDGKQCVCGLTGGVK